MRRLLLTLVAGLLAATVAVAVAPPATAHSDVVGGSPRPGAELAAGAALLRVEFESVDADAPGYLALYDERDRPMRVGDAVIAGDSVCARTEELGPGVYALAYVVTDADQHRLEGRYEFAVTAGGEASSAGGCDAASLDPPKEARTIAEATTGGLPDWLPWALGALVVAGAVGVGVRVALERRDRIKAREAAE